MKHAGPLFALLITVGLTLPVFADRYDNRDGRYYNSDRANHHKVDHFQNRYDRYDNKRWKHQKKHFRHDRKHRKYDRQRRHKDYYRDNRRDFDRRYYFHNYRSRPHRHGPHCRHYGGAHRYNSYIYRDDDFYKWVAGAIIVKELIHHAGQGQNYYEYRVYDD